ncbi:hypothetical protein PghCCS26_41370 [Paenibacillus glycanilyticus]|uniref:Uncharacterized protein n=1 Tax=Paenibacillus glycanilyticus TaxID=126569 RepID=A0ABQ6NPJ7_9BACL|nr:hypothetical protein PghCCS26_41370 [Paenibacillus glycanilyticus]
MIRKFSFWLPFISFIFLVFHWSQLDSKTNFDDKGLLVYYTSPPFLIAEQHFAFDHEVLFYCLTIVFWFLIGWIIDRLIKSLIAMLKKAKY